MKKYVLVLLGLSLMLSLAACGKEDDSSLNSDSKGKTENSGEYVTLGEYKNIPVTKNVYTVSQEALEEEVEMTLDEYSEELQVDRASQDGDELTLYFTASVDGEVMEDYSEDGYYLFLGEEEYGSEFDEKLTGVKAGDHLTFSITYPEDDESEYSGETVDFDVTVDTVTEYVLPEYTEEFVKENLEYDSIEAFEADLKATLEEEYEDTSLSELQEDLITQVIENAVFGEYDEEVYQMYCDAMAESYQEYAEMYGMEYEELLSAFGMTEEDLEEEALDSLQRDSVIEAIAEAENITVSDEEYEEALAGYAEEEEYDDTESYVEEYGEDNIRSWILEEKVLNFLMENADITEQEAEYGEEL